MGYNKGKEIEDRIIRQFKGTKSNIDFYDFETKTRLYEVKSCNLFNITSNERTSSFQLGRFWIKNENHPKLIDHAKHLKKKPYYVFVIVVGKQIIMKTVKAVDITLNENKEYTYLLLGNLFGDAYYTHNPKLDLLTVIEKESKGCMINKLTKLFGDCSEELRKLREKGDIFEIRPGIVKRI